MQRGAASFAMGPLTLVPQLGVVNSQAGVQQRLTLVVLANFVEPLMNSAPPIRMEYSPRCQCPRSAGLLPFAAAMQRSTADCSRTALAPAWQAVVCCCTGQGICQAGCRHLEAQVATWKQLCSVLLPEQLVGAGELVVRRHVLCVERQKDLVHDPYAQPFNRRHLLLWKRRLE